MRRIFLVAAFVITACTIALVWHGEEIHFSTVSIYNGSAPGSAPEVYLKELEPFLRKSLVGEPKIIVHSVPGAGGINNANTFHNTASRSGSHVLLLVPGMTAVLAKNPAIKFDIAKMQHIGMTRSDYVLVSSRGSGLKNAKDLLSAERDIVVGSGSPRGLISVLATSFFGVLENSNFRHVSGYPGTAEIIKALQTKGIEASDVVSALKGSKSADSRDRPAEIGLGFIPTHMFLKLREGLEQQGIVGLLQTGFLKDDGTVGEIEGVELPTLMSFIEVHKPAASSSEAYRTLKLALGAGTVSYSFFLPEGASVEAARVWCTALARAHGDQEYRKIVIAKTGMDTPFLSCEKAGPILDRAAALFREPAAQGIIREVFLGK